MSAIDELIEFMRGLEADHKPEGWPCVHMQQITMLPDHITVKAAPGDSDE